jgi:hypothetical protein
MSSTPLVISLKPMLQSSTTSTDRWTKSGCVTLPMSTRKSGVRSHVPHELNSASPGPNSPGQSMAVTTDREPLNGFRKACAYCFVQTENL